MKDQNPVGVVIPWIRDQPLPDGYLAINSRDQWVGREVYPDLFAAVGDVYNDGAEADKYEAAGCFCLPYMPTPPEDEKIFIIKASYLNDLVLTQPTKDRAEVIRITMAQIAETLIQMHSAGPFCLIVQANAAGGDLEVHFQEQQITFRKFGQSNGG